jgi:hypothetical protein
MVSVLLNDREKIAWTDQLDDAHLVDVDAEGRVVGIDIMTLDDLKIDEMAARFGFADDVPAINSAIQGLTTPTPTSGSFGSAPVVQALVVEGTAAPHPSADAATEGSVTPQLVPPIVA